MNELPTDSIIDAQQIITNISKFNFKDVALSDLSSYAVRFGTNLITAIAVFIIGRLIIKYALKLVQKLMRKRRVEPSLFTFLDSFLHITLNLILAIIVIGILGIDTSSLIAIFASAGLAIGMALSGTLQNFAGGVMILIFKPYRVGHYIESGEYAGTVKEIQIFNTILLTVDHQTIIIPNGNLATGSLKNYSTAPQRRIDIDVEVAYGTKPEDVRNVLNKIIEEDDRIMRLGEFEPVIPMTTMSASSIVFQMRLWTSSANYWPVRFDTTEKIYTRLTEAGIEIPFQQLDVHVK